MDNIFSNTGGQKTGETEAGLTDISPNRTLIAGQYTPDAAIKSDIVHGLETLEQVFAHFRPRVAVEFRDSEGHIVSETLQFRGPEDFSAESIRNQSRQLQESAAREAEYLHIISQLRNNKNLQAVLEDGGAKQTLLDALHGMKAILQNNP